MPTLKTTSRNLHPPSLDGDVGYNLPASTSVVVKADGFCQVPTGIKVELPPGIWGLIVARSSANRSGIFVVLPGVIDNGYRGELTVMVHNLSEVDVNVIEGTSLGQLVLLPCVIYPVELVSSLNGSARGENAYGHTGQAVVV